MFGFTFFSLLKIILFCCFYYCWEILVLLVLCIMFLWQHPLVRRCIPYRSGACSFFSLHSHFMKLFVFSCLSPGLISLIAFVGFHGLWRGCCFPLPDQLLLFSIHLLHFIFSERSDYTYFFRCEVSASHIAASTRFLILWIFSKTFPFDARPQNFSGPKGKIIR